MAFPAPTPTSDGSTFPDHPRPPRAPPTELTFILLAGAGERTADTTAEELLKTQPMVGDANLFLKGAPPGKRKRESAAEDKCEQEGEEEEEEEEDFEAEVEIMIAGTYAPPLLAPAPWGPMGTDGDPPTLLESR